MDSKVNANSFKMVGDLSHTVADNKTTINGKFELNGKMIKVTYKTSASLSKDQLEEKINEKISQMLPMLAELGTKTRSISVNRDGTLTKTYTNKSNVEVTKHYNQQRLAQKLDKALQRKEDTQDETEQKKLDTKIAIIRAGLIIVASSPKEVSQKTTFTAPPEQQVKSQEKKAKEPLSLKQIENAIIETRVENGKIQSKVRALNLKLKDAFLSDESRTALEVEKRHLLNELKEKTQAREKLLNEYEDRLFKGDILVKTNNVYTDRLDHEVKVDIKNAYQEEIEQLRSANPENLQLLQALDNLSEINETDLHSGFCLVMSNSFLKQLEPKSTLTEKDIAEAAKPFEQGILDPKAVARQILMFKVNESAGNQMHLFVTSKKRQQAPQGLGSFFKIPDRDIFYALRKFDNLFQKAEGFKQKKVRIDKPNPSVINIPENLLAGCYNISISTKPSEWDDFNPWKKISVSHALAFVKIDENTSYLLDPNLGVIKCGNAEQTKAQLAKVQQYYSDIGFDVKKLRTAITKTVPLTPKG